MKIMCKLFGHKWIHHIIRSKHYTRYSHYEVEVFCKRCHIPQSVEITGKMNEIKLK